MVTQLHTGHFSKVRAGERSPTVPACEAEDCFLSCEQEARFFLGGRVSVRVTGIEQGRRPTQSVRLSSALLIQ